MQLSKEFLDEIISIRHDIHQNPEVSLKEYKTSEYIEKIIIDNGIDYKKGFAGTGIVAKIKKGTSDKKIGLRCELDALSIFEQNNFEHKSKIDGVMHACGHDGHMAMLIGAMLYINNNDIDFNGEVYFIFQPGEEGFAGAEKMIKDGLFEYANVDEIYSIHNWPGIEVGKAGVRNGPIMAATDTFKITINGQSSHAAMPNLGVDVINIGANIINALNQIVSRNVDPMDNCVVSATIVDGGTAVNIIPEINIIKGTIRTFDKNVRELVLNRIKKICDGFSVAFDCDINFDLYDGYPATINDDECTNHALKSIQIVLGDESVMTNINPSMGGEDFSYMLEKVKGAYIWIGNGFTKNLHNSKYDFNDDIIKYGVQYWIEIVKNRLNVV